MSKETFRVLLEEFNDSNKRREIIKTIQNSSLITWKHVNLKGEYDFSDAKIRDKYDLKLEKRSYYNLLNHSYTKILHIAFFIIISFLK